jgi:ABC-2 type transport system ATP-binding protein
MLLGLVRPTSGTALINGQPFGRLGRPAGVVGAVLEAQGFHPRRTARNHMHVYAAAAGVPDGRADQLLELVGLGSAAGLKVGGYSLGMRQRLALATALIGDPQILLLDEPANGLDPEGITWLRTFLQGFARTGRTVLMSSHLLAEVGQTVDQVVIIASGRTVYQGRLDDLRDSQQGRVIVRPSDPAALLAALRGKGIGPVGPTPDGQLVVIGAGTKDVADIALAAGVSIYGIHEDKPDLERLFFQLTGGQSVGPVGYPPPVPFLGQPPPPGAPPQHWQVQPPAPPSAWAPPPTVDPLTGRPQDGGPQRDTGGGA